MNSMSRWSVWRDTAYQVRWRSCTCDVHSNVYSSIFALLQSDNICGSSYVRDWWFLLVFLHHFRLPSVHHFYSVNLSFFEFFHIFNNFHSKMVQFEYISYRRTFTSTNDDDIHSPHHIHIHTTTTHNSNYIHHYSNHANDVCRRIWLAIEVTFCVYEQKSGRR